MCAVLQLVSAPLPLEEFNFPFPTIWQLFHATRLACVCVCVRLCVRVGGEPGGGGIQTETRSILHGQFPELQTDIVD